MFRPGVSTTAFAEMYRILSASVSLLGVESNRKVTLFSSALPGEGKSLTSANFALAAAGQGRRTLLIDLDLTEASFHKFFGYIRSKGRNGYYRMPRESVTFSDAIIRDTGVENLHFVFSGKGAKSRRAFKHRSD